MKARVRLCAKLLKSCPTLCNPMDCIPPGSSVRGDSPGKSTGVCCRALLQGIFPTQGSDPGIKLASPALAGRSFTTEPPGKPSKAEQGLNLKKTWAKYIQNQGPRRLL